MSSCHSTRTVENLVSTKAHFEVDHIQLGLLSFVVIRWFAEFVSQYDVVCRKVTSLVCGAQFVDLHGLAQLWDGMVG